MIRPSPFTMTSWDTISSMRFSRTNCTNPGFDEDDLNEFAKQWLNGWLEAVADFWAHVESKL